jgi:hypothetical protein
MTEGLDHLVDVLLLQANGKPTRVANTILIDAFALNVKVGTDLDIEGYVPHHARVHQKVGKKFAGFDQFGFVPRTDSSDCDLHNFSPSI